MFIDKEEIKIIDEIFDLVKEKDLHTKYGKYKLGHKLKLIKSKHPNNSTVTNTVNYIINNMICKKAFTKEPTRFVNLRSQYTEQEVKNINKMFGFALDNELLNEDLLEFGYRQNENIPGAKELYCELKIKFFRPKEFNSELEEKKVRNLVDKVYYETVQR